MTAGTSRWERWARPRVLIAVVVVVLLTTVGLIVLYSLLLGRMSKRVEEGSRGRRTCPTPTARS